MYLSALLNTLRLEVFFSSTLGMFFLRVSKHSFKCARLLKKIHKIPNSVQTGAKNFSRCAFEFNIMKKLTPSQQQNPLGLRVMFMSSGEKDKATNLQKVMQTEPRAYTLTHLFFSSLLCTSLVPALKTENTHKHYSLIDKKKKYCTFQTFTTLKMAYLLQGRTQISTSIQDY